MTCKLTPSKPRLILFCGHAGTGKSTLAKKALPIIIDKTGEDFFFLDKDTAYGAFTAQMMKLTTGNPNDRDSPYYLENMRNWEYSGLIDIARENLALGVNVILVGPFSKEVQRGKMFETAELVIPEEVIIRAAWIDLNEDESKRRIELRADPRDDWKLNHWDQYVQRRIEPPSHPSLQRFNNLEFDEMKFHQLIDFLIK